LLSLPKQPDRFERLAGRKFPFSLQDQQTALTIRFDASSA
jgi:hypothetical protein